jgi:dienelactone hydrolase
MNTNWTMCGAAWLAAGVLTATMVLAQTPAAGVPAQPDAAVQAAMQRDREARNSRPDSPGTGPYAATYDEDPSLPKHVVFHPIDLDALFQQKLGVLVWGNGGCQADGAAVRLHLADIASYGYLVIAPGSIQSGPRAKAGAGGAPPARPPGGALPPPATTTDDVRAGLDWALAENTRKGSRYFGRIDPRFVAVAGYSCGGLQALQLATSDARIHAVVIQNSGLFPDGRTPIPNLAVSKSQLGRLHTPIIYIIGNKTDIAYDNAQDDFSRIGAVPALLASYQHAGHEGTYGQPHGGPAAAVATRWLQWQLRGDTRAARMFTGDDCGLCKDKNWAIQRNAAFVNTETK